MTIGARVYRLYTYLERTIVVVLLVMLMVVVVWATWALTAELLTRLFLRLSGGVRIDSEWSGEFARSFNIVREVFGAFLVILIGLELMKTVVMYLDKHVLHVEVVLTVAVIAIARHAIDLDIAHVEPLTLVGMGAMILALAIGYYYFRKASAGAPSAEGLEGQVPAPPSSAAK